MTDADDATVNRLLASLALVSHALWAKCAELKSDPDWSEIAVALDISGPIPDDELPEMSRDEILKNRRLGAQEMIIDGYVDGTPRGWLGANWTFAVVDLGSSGWSLDRQVTLYPLEGDDIVASLPEARFENWYELAVALPGLIDQLLVSPLPASA